MLIQGLGRTFRSFLDQWGVSPERNCRTLPLRVTLTLFLGVWFKQFTLLVAPVNDPKKWGCSVLDWVLQNHKQKKEKKKSSKTICFWYVIIVMWSWLITHLILKISVPVYMRQIETAMSQSSNFFLYSSSSKCKVWTKILACSF